MRRRELEPAPAPRAKPIRREMLELEAWSIVLDPLRRPTRPRAELEAGALERDIRARGLDHAVTVRKLADGRFAAVTGEEIIAACLAIDRAYPVLAIVIPPDQGDAASMSIARLAEHAHRSELRSWELAIEFHRLSLPPHCLSAAELARRTGYREAYVANLLRLRKKLAPAIWTRWTEVGESLPVNALLEVCILLEQDQAAELAEILSGRRRRSGTRRPRVSRRAIEKRLEELERELHRAEVWCDGAEHALRWVLGERPWRQDVPAAEPAAMVFPGRSTR